MKLPTQDNSALIHLGFAAVTLGFCCIALFTHDPSTQTQLWQVVFLLVGLWLPSPAQSSTVNTLIQQLVAVLTALAQHPAQAAPAQETDILASVKAATKETI